MWQDFLKKIIGIRAHNYTFGKFVNKATFAKNLRGQPYNNLKPWRRCFGL
jgi:hypothetical protein